MINKLSPGTDCEEEPTENKPAGKAKGQRDLTTAGEARAPAPSLRDPLRTKLNMVPAGRGQVLMKPCSEAANEDDQSGF